MDSATNLQDRNEELERRIFELDDFRERVEASAAEAVAIADELAITARRAEDASREARTSEALIKTILDGVEEAILTVGQDGVIAFANSRSKHFFGMPADSIPGRELCEMLVCPDNEVSSVATIPPTGGEYLVQRDDRELWVGLSVSEIAIGGQTQFTCVLRDVSERRELEARMREMALTDPVTGLLNRHGFQNRLKEALALARRSGERVGLALIDLDDFKEINDSFGHPVGDAQLARVGDVLKRIVRQSDAGARIGGDEFAVIATNIDGRGGVSRLAAAITEEIGWPATLDGSLVKGGASVGIGVFPDDAEDADELIRCADRALYSAKSAGGQTHRFFDDSINRWLRDRQILDNDLRLCLARDEIAVHFQPQVFLETGRIVGLEALARWSHPTKGFVPPIEFISHAETSGLIVPLGESVLRRACSEVRAICGDRVHIPVSVNVSSYQLETESFGDSVFKILDETGFDPGCLELEITERVMLKDDDTIKANLTALSDAGVHVSIDDFGTGYSNLSSLSQLWATKLKIDRSFVDAVVSDKKSNALCRAVVELGHCLKMSVVAEGIETVEQAQALLDIACEWGQGYYYGRPMPARDLRPLL